MHPLYDALYAPYAVVGVTRKALIAHRYTYAPHDFFPLVVSIWNDLADPVFDCVGLSGFKSRAKAFSLA